MRVPASDADRDRLLELLREHYARGNIDDAELERRSTIALTAPDKAAAAAAVADLPPLAASASRQWGERGRHGHADQAGPGWIPTSERFRDPTSQRIVRVWIDPADNGRYYVPEQG